MKFTIITLFPELIHPFFSHSIAKKAIEKGLVEYQVVPLRDFCQGTYASCDDIPYGGGAGMVLQAEPLKKALDSVQALEKTVVYPSPAGKVFSQKWAASLQEQQELVFICGRYEGIDQRIIELFSCLELSVGDYVLSGGELSTLVMVDAIFRLKEGVLAQKSLQEESFSDTLLLEYPHYTRPRVYQGLEVPGVLLSGHHKAIRRWRQEQRERRTKERRPDLWKLFLESEGRCDE